MINADKKKLNILRTVICAIILCGLMCGALWGYVKGLEIITDKLEQINPDKTGDMDNTLWLVEHIMFILPVCVLLIFQLIFYSIWKEKDVTVLHKECFISLLTAFLFTYAIMLPAVIIYSNNAPAALDEMTGEELPSLWIRSAEWFIWQFMIFLAPLLYRKVAADTAKNLEEEEEKLEEDN